MKRKIPPALRDAECKKLGQHMIVWHGVGLCCIHLYDADPKRPPRSYTLPIREIPPVEVAA